MFNLKIGNKISIRKLDNDDKATYHDLYYSSSSFKAVFNEILFENIWKEANSESILVCTIVEKGSGRICGFCQLDGANTRTPKIGIDMIEAFRGRGYAQEAVRLLIEYASKSYDIDHFIWEAVTTNRASKHIAEKFGGMLIKEKTYLPQKIIDFGLENGSLTEEDITYICCYRIDKI